MEYQYHGLYYPNSEVAETDRSCTLELVSDPTRWTQSIAPCPRPTLLYHSSPYLRYHYDDIIVPKHNVNCVIDIDCYLPKQWASNMGTAPSLSEHSNLSNSHSSDAEQAVGYNAAFWSFHPYTVSDMAYPQPQLAWVPHDATQGNDSSHLIGLIQDVGQAVEQDKPEVLQQRPLCPSNTPQPPEHRSEGDQGDWTSLKSKPSFELLNTDVQTFERNTDDDLSSSNGQHICLVIDDVVGGSRYPCPFRGCSQTFKRKEHVNRHYKTKHDRVWLTCEFCGKNTFNRSDNLDAHRKLHARKRTTYSKGVHYVPAAMSALKKKKRGRPWHKTTREIRADFTTSQHDPRKEHQCNYF